MMNDVEDDDKERSPPPPPPLLPVVRTTLEIHPIDNYTFGTKASDPASTAAVARGKFDATLMERDYQAHGMIQSVGAVLVVHDHGHPHLLLLQLTDRENCYQLPGQGRLAPGEDELSGLMRLLDEQLGGVATSTVSDAPLPLPAHHRWDIVELLANWWRPNVAPQMYPYLPAHVTRPKEQLGVFLVRLRPRQAFAVPKHYKLLAVPLCELYQSGDRYASVAEFSTGGAIISGLPYTLSHINFIVSSTRVE